MTFIMWFHDLFFTSDFKLRPVQRVCVALSLRVWHMSLPGQCLRWKIMKPYNVGNESIVWGLVSNLLFAVSRQGSAGRAPPKDWLSSPCSQPTVKIDPRTSHLPKVDRLFYATLDKADSELFTESIFLTALNGWFRYGGLFNDLPRVASNYGPS